jgi:hypothetical protein
MFKKFKEIVEGWRNYIFEDPKVEEIAKKRAAACSICPHAVMGSWNQKMPDKTIQVIKGMKCSLCGCPLSAKCRSLDSECPILKWKAENA